MAACCCQLLCRTGLGLYLVQQTLTGMGSSLAAVSEVGKGSSFEFDMPLADSDCESESEADADLFSEPSRWVRQCRPGKPGGRGAVTER